MKNLKLWTRADNYIGYSFDDYYVGLAVTRDSNLIDQSNFEVMLEKLGGEKGGVIVAESGHWACGWVKLILVHKNSKAKLKRLSNMLTDLDNYPILDEDDFYEREQEYLEKSFEYYKDDYVKAVKQHMPLLSKINAEKIAWDIYLEDASYRGAEECSVNRKSIERFFKEQEQSVKVNTGKEKL